MSFLRHEEIYRSDVGKTERGSHADPFRHRFDEFPAGYSLAGCSPAVPTAASPTAVSMGGPVGRDNRCPPNGNLSLISLSHSWGPPQVCPR
jgi:hypothetical protein